MTNGINREYRDAFDQYVEAYGRAAKCVTFAPITTPRIDFRHPDRTYTVALAQMDPARCAARLSLAEGDHDVPDSLGRAGGDHRICGH